MTHIPLTNTDRTTRVDDSDAERVGAYRWFLHTQKGWVARSFASGRRGGAYRTLHGWLLDAQPGQRVLHRDGDYLNNMRANLALIEDADFFLLLFQRRLDPPGPGLDWLVSLSAEQRGELRTGHRAMMWARYAIIEARRLSGGRRHEGRTGYRKGLG